MTTEREQFEAKFKHLNLEKKPDAWGVPKYVCSHVDAIWYGWQAAQAAPGEAVVREPDGYAYRYPALLGDGTVIRFETGGREINASKPIEAIPYYLGTRPTDAAAIEREATIDRMLAEHTERVATGKAEAGTSAILLVKELRALRNPPEQKEVE